MGTRHLVAVVLDGDFKIAQYGQWDGYPEGQGETVVSFLWNEFDREKFTAALRASRFLTQDECNSISKDQDWKRKHPQLSRDMGAEVLKFVQESSGCTLADQRSFAGDSLFCEWAYVIDLDTNVLEVYRGFNKSLVKPPGRFADVKCENNGYYPIMLAQSYPLGAMPTYEKFLSDFRKDDEEAA